MVRSLCGKNGLLKYHFDELDLIKDSVATACLEAVSLGSDRSLDGGSSHLRTAERVAIYGARVNPADDLMLSTAEVSTGFAGRLLRTTLKTRKQGCM